MTEPPVPVTQEAAGGSGGAEAFPGRSPVKPSVLIVEDQPIVAADLDSRLRRLGYDVVASTRSGEEALALSKKLRPSLVLMDIRLAGRMDGVEAARRIRQETRRPVVYLTAHSDQATLDLAKTTEAFGCVVKPYDGRELKTTIEMALYKHAAEQRLRESEERYRTLVEMSPSAVFVVQRGKVAFANPATLRLFGAQSPEQVVGRPAVDLVHPADRDRVRAAIEAIMGGGVGSLQGVRNLKLDGRTIWTDGSGVLVEFGGSAAAQVVVSDITERQLTERALLESRAAALELMEEAFASRKRGEEVSEDLRLEIEVRRAAEQALQRLTDRFEVLAVTAGQLLESTEPKEVITRVCGRVMEYLDCQVYFNFLADPVAGNLRLNGYLGIPGEAASAISRLAYGAALCGCVAREGARIVAERIPDTPDRRTDLLRSFGVKAFACHPLLGPGAEVIGTLGFGSRSRETFTEEDLALMKSVADLVATALSRHLSAETLRRTVLDLARSNQDLEQFAYVASHDLQEPLRMVSGFVSLLQERYGDRLDEKGRVFIHQAELGAARMRQLIEDLLEYSRTGRGGLSREPVACREALEAALANLAPRIAESGAEVTAGELPVLSADRTQLSVVFQDLIGNALKYHREGVPPRISVEARCDGGTWVIAVRDNGIGIPADQFEKIFAIFQRLHTREAFGGTGVGLAIVKKIVEAHGGSVRVESSVGVGSTFFFTIPG